jgi:hypothetical protein
MTTVVTSACSGINGGRTSCTTVFHVAPVFFDISIPLSGENQTAAPLSSVCDLKKRLLFESTA